MIYTMPNMNSCKPLELILNGVSLYERFNSKQQEHAEALIQIAEKYSNEPKVKNAPLYSHLNSDYKALDKELVYHTNALYNHTLFSRILKPAELKIDIPSELKFSIKLFFNTFDKFVEEFYSKAVETKPEGWCWLVMNNGRLEIRVTGYTEPLIGEGIDPLLCLYIPAELNGKDYMELKKCYINLFLQNIHWNEVNALYLQGVMNFQQKNVFRR
ncbi:Fe-Mn family superoxide dismutase [Priestia megaterium]|uniref:Fe-Mn family superoxide dismutase n=1 Tax=Priestia megaterium TaxID=1404 RepID=UPI00159B8E3E|nr:Fe-Mn family superoxide dismutase [Priestia megaterium]